MALDQPNAVGLEEERRTVDAQAAVGLEIGQEHRGDKAQNWPEAPTVVVDVRGRPDWVASTCSHILELVAAEGACLAVQGTFWKVNCQICHFTLSPNINFFIKISRPSQNLTQIRWFHFLCQPY